MTKLGGHFSKDSMYELPLSIPALSQNLVSPSLSMIALAGMIGTGLFLSSGRALANAGPLGCLLAFVLMGTVTASIAYISAEMSAFKPVEAGFVRHATMWLGRSTGIATGWNFWYSMAITMPAEISAATALVGFWNPTLNQAIPISILWLAIAVINFSAVRLYGEFEFYFAILKISLIILFLIAGIVLDLGGFPQQNFIGSRYWKSPYPLFREYTTSGAEGRFLGFWSAMISAAFAYGNVQVVAIAGAETRNPRKAIPTALKRTFTRVIVFYVASIFVISLIVPANDTRLSLPTGDVTHSPFVIAFSSAGIKGIPSVMNAIILTSAFSSGNACTFLASRTIHGLALDGHAPSFLLSLNRFGAPYWAVAVSVIWGAIAYTGLNNGASQVGANGFAND
uniref:Amino acid permease/ SLC12A domain-containing protein n=1 Tax=Psilocybe cubensis TaxID=181762 RepID=A0A8H8CI17_PSICU